MKVLRLPVTYLLPVLVFLYSGNVFSQTKLDKSKEEIKNDKSKDEVKYSYSSDASSSSTRDRSSVFDNLIFEILANLVYGSTIGNYNREDHLHNDVTDYPFKYGVTGNYVKPDSAIVKRYPRVDIENTFLFDREPVYGNHIKIKIRPFKYLYAKTDYFQLIEYNQIKKNYSGLALFSFNVCYDRIRFERFNLGWNIGVNYMGSGVNKAGLAFGFSTDIFPVNKVSINSAVCWSAMNGVAVNQLEAKGNYHIDKWLFTIGYNRLRMGTPIYKFLSIGAGVFL